VRLLYLTLRVTDHDLRFSERILADGHNLLAVSLTPASSTTLPIVTPRGEPVPLVSLPWDAANDRAAISRLQELAGEFAPDVVHAGPLPSAAYLAARAGLRPLVAASWAYDVLLEAAEDPALRSRAVLALAEAVGLIVDARAVEEGARDLGYHGPITCAAWGVDLRRFRPPSDRWPASHRWVLSDRAWEPMYDVEGVVDAFALAHAQDPHLRLKLVNQGSRADTIVARVKDAGLEQVVEMPGRLSGPDLAEALRQADVYVSAARVDGSSVSLLEALATGLPVVATDIPGNREWLTGSDGSRLTAVGDRGAAAAAINELAELDTATRARVSRTHRRLAEQRADWERNGGLIVGAYVAAAAGGATQS
jgi:glycosyltransferase involved in cell wall biosynthesis